ncbi:sodium:solute symporter family protein [Acidiphilium cryptum]|uniref:Na+/solute symporter n=1 Tax=Acidiphilium cryptum (strain JF-5) TaxID=349163 RepID=A5FTM9_ACICJ|nr:sodium:solute symporter family protein [Acidiphilium cryptum]ABQ28961.1 Na+/solute symporter [Acidiphilium cryptum JF-5]
MLITFGGLALFFAIIVIYLQISFRRDRDFGDYAVAGRSFGAFFQSMSFLNTWYPGAIFIAFGGLAATAGVISFYLLMYSLLTIVVMYVISNRVWLWGKEFNLYTQPDLFALRYDSKNLRLMIGVIGIVSQFPWIILGMKALGMMFYYMALKKIDFDVAVILGVILMVIRQFWTVQMGMRGVVISDMLQGVVSYIGGSLLLIGLIGWLMIDRHASFAALPDHLFEIPGFGSKQGPLYVFALIFTSALGGWCWPGIFVRLFTADSVGAMKKAAAISAPISLIFGAAVLILAMLASTIPAVAKAPDAVWFIVNQQAGGLVLLSIAGIIILASTMGNIDGNIQSTGAQIANDIIGDFTNLDEKQKVLAAKIGMVAITLLGAWIATMKIPQLFNVAVIGYQGIIQLAVPQFLGIFWLRGNRAGAYAGTIVGFVLAVVLTLHYPAYVGPLWGLTSGFVALAVNFAVYVACAYIFPHTPEEERRVRGLFGDVAGQDVSVAANVR